MAEEIKFEAEDFLWDPNMARAEIDHLVSMHQSEPPKRKSGRRPKRRAVPPGSTLCTPASLDELRVRFNISEGVEFVIPEPSDRAHNPPPDCFTVYEAFFNLCFLWFPIPEVILRYLWMHSLALAQIKVRGLRHLVGILVRSYECDVEVSVDHLRNLLDIRRVSKSLPAKFYIGNKKNKKIITGFPSKDIGWEDHFFFVRISEASVDISCLRLIRTSWGQIDRDFLPPVPADLDEVFDALKAEKVHWGKHFSLRRVERARATASGVSVSSGPSSSGDLRTKIMEEMHARDKEAREAREAARRNAGGAVVTASEVTLAVFPEVPAFDDEMDLAPCPAASVLAKHIDKRCQKRPLSSDNRGDAAREEERADVSGSVDFSLPATIVDDAVASAAILTQISGSGVRLPPFGVQINDGAYAEMSLRGIRCVASVNELVATYESSICRDKLLVENARGEALALKCKRDEAERRLVLASAKISDLEREKGSLRENSAKAAGYAISLYKEGIKRAPVVGSLRRQLEVKKALHDTKVKKAWKAARRESARRFKSRLDKIRMNVDYLEVVKDRELDLAEVNSNLELLDILRKDNPSTLEAEEEKLTSWKAELTGADKEFARIVSCMKDELVAPVSEDSVATLWE